MVSNGNQARLAGLIGVRIGTLPVRYMGVLLIASKLKESDCRPLIDKIVARITAWTSRFLSYTGRLQLIS